MNCLSRVSSCAGAILGRKSHCLARSSFNQCSSPLLIRNSGFGLGFEFLSRRSRVRCCSSRKVGGKKASRKSKQKTEAEPVVMGKEGDAFYVVRKGDLVGVYKSLNECQAQVGSSICDPPVSVFKGNSLPEKTEHYLMAYGLQNALYTIRAADLKEGLFGTLMPCPVQQLYSSTTENLIQDVSKKRSHQVLGLQTVEVDGSSSSLSDPLKKHIKLEGHAIAQNTCILEFDGASKGNPGPAGAGVVLRTDDGRLICKLQEGLGTATSNVAEYRAIILGLKCALQKGYTRVHVQGDSKLVCSQVEGTWQVKHPNLTALYEQVKELKEHFTSFKISHVLRALNSEADAQANLAVNLADGQIQEAAQ